MMLIADSIKALKSEWIKLKGTGVWYMILGTSLFISVSGLLLSLFANVETKPSPGNPWPRMIESSMNGFMFFYLLLSILMVVRLCQTEHRNQGWKLIETQPIHRLYLFFAKFKMAILLSLFALFAHLVISLIFAYGYALYKKDVSFTENAIPWLKVVSYILRIWISSWGLIAFQYIISIWIANFTLPFLIGFVLTVVAMPMQFSGTATWFPFAAPLFSVQNFDGGIVSAWLLHYEKLSIAWMMLFLWTGYQYYFHRNWKHTLLTGKQAMKFGFAAGLFAAVFYFIEKPVVNGRYTSTVLAGTISGDHVKTDIVFLDPVTMDTIMNIPVRDGKFHAVYTGRPLQPGTYALSMGNRKVDIFMGQNDSIFLTWELNDVYEQAQIRGTRIAENSKPLEYYYQDYGMMKNKPSVFTSSLLEQWQSDMKAIEGYKTVDNIRPSNDFIDITKKLATVSYLQALDIDYPNMHAMYYPGDTLKYPASLDPVFKTLSYNDTTIAMYDKYITLLDRALRKKNNLKPLDLDSSYLSAILRDNKPQKLKDRFLYWSMGSMVTSNMDSARRSALFSAFIPEEKDSVLARKLHQLLALQNSLAKGMPAPEVDAVSIAGKKMGWKDFKGRYVLVDVWATWCGPCKTEVPFFDRYADMYSGDKVAFVSLSVDQGKDVFSWQFEAQNKSKRIVQLRAENPTEFMNMYGITGIPRFLLINPDGKIAMISMPRPSDPLFEDYLRRQVPGL